MRFSIGCRKMITNSPLITTLISEYKIPKVVINNLMELQPSLPHFGLALVKEGYITRVQMGELIADHYNTTYIELSKTTLDKNLMKMVSKKLAEDLQFVAIYEFGETVTVATCEMENPEKHKEIEFILNKKGSFLFSFPDEIKKQHTLFYKSLDQVDETEYGAILSRFNATTEISKNDLQKLLDDNEIIHMLDALFHYALREKASDIHIEPYKRTLVVRFRIDGRLQNVMNLPIDLQDSIVNRLKIISKLDISEKRYPHDGKFSVTIAGHTVDIRISIVPTIYGEKVVLRLLAIDIFNEKPNLFELGITDHILKDIRVALQKSNGMFFITGPTGAGKTTTLYAIIDYLKNPEINIVTIEDPVEYEVNGITQIEVDLNIGRDFSMILRSILRQDPDVILVGEIRDLETAQIAATAALTGQTVLTTLHTNTAIQAITRMTDMGVHHFVVAPAIIGIINQRLVRMICSFCAYAYKPNLSDLGIFRIEDESEIPMVYRGKGCEACNFTGYKGRIPIMEFIKISNKLRSAILHGESHDVLFQIAKSEGYKDLRYDGFIKVFQGLTTLEEVLRVSSTAETDLEMLIE